MLITRITPQLDDQIFQDFLRFYDQENQLHLRHPDRSPDHNDSVVENIGTLNPQSLNDAPGRKRIDYLFGGQSVHYQTGLRIATFTSACVIRYGEAVMGEYQRRCLRALEEYGARREVIRALAKRYRTFWTYPLFIRAFNHFVQLRMALPRT